MDQLLESRDDDNCVPVVEETGTREQKLLSQTQSTTSIDSGTHSYQQSRNPSSSSLVLQDASYHCITDPFPVPTDIPTITIDEVQADGSVRQKREDNSDHEMASDVTQIDWQLLNISTRTRKESNTSSLSSNSSEYFTAPNSPDLPSLTRSRSLDDIVSLIPLHFCPADTNSFQSPQTAATHIERKNNSIYVTVDSPTSPVEVELHLRPHPLKISFKDQKQCPTSTSSSTHENLPSDLTIRISTGPASPQLDFVPLTTKNKTENERIAEIVRRNLVDFSNSTNLEALYSHLVSSSLLSTSDYEQLEACKSTNIRMNHFYIWLLPRKGKHAYETLYQCLKNETTHRGHKSLVNLIGEES